MKRFATVIFCSILLLFVYISTSSATPIIGGEFDGWDVDPLISAVSISDDGVATMKIQPYDDNVTSISLTHNFTGVSAISFDVNFINGDLRVVPLNMQGYSPNFLQVSFLSESGEQTGILGYDKNGVYDLSTLATIAVYGDWYHIDITNLGGIVGALYFTLQDMGDEYLSQGIISNVNVTESQAAPVPEPSNMLLLGGGLVVFLLLRSRKMHVNG